MDTAQWPQGIGVVNKAMEGSTSRAMLERRARPQKDQALNCPRCNSTNTKFCYYNNYSLTQPRYFCKTCRRYWTEGGSLRNVPVGGGSRKNKRSTSTSSPISPISPSSSKKQLPDLMTQQQPSFSSHSASQNPKIHEGQDLNLAYPPTHEDHYNSAIPKYVEVPYNDNKNPTTTSSSTSSHLEFLKSGIIASRGLNSFMPMPVSDSTNTSLYSSGFPMQEFKPTLNFSMDGFESGYGSLQGVQQNSTARLLFPFEDLKQVSSPSEFEQNRGQGDSNTGYWSGMLGGGSSW